MQTRKVLITSRVLAMQHSHPEATQALRGFHSISPTSPRFKETAKWEAPAQDVDPTGMARGLQFLQASWPHSHPSPTLGVPGAPLHPGSFMGMESPRGGSHLQTLPFGTLQPPVQRSKISNPFNESSHKIIPLKSLRP